MALRNVFTRALAAVACASVLLLAAPGVSQAKKAPSSPTSYYVSIGDSYSVGYQPVPGGPTPGYTGYVAKKLKLTLENFGCGGATSGSVLTVTGPCGSNGFGPPAGTGLAPVPSGETQIQAADDFITAHHGQIGLVTVSIGGNDITSCAGAANPITCVSAALSTVNANVNTLMSDLETALNGETTPIVGLTYPDVILGEWVANPPNTSIANLSAIAFKDLINPDLKTDYTSVPNGKFADVTEAKPLTLSLTKTKKFGAHGVVPVAVIEVCKLTWFCSSQAPGNIHATSKGYKLEGKTIVAALKG